MKLAPVPGPNPTGRVVRQVGDNGHLVSTSAQLFAQTIDYARIGADFGWEIDAKQ
jgi:hypothetical protein